MRRRLRLLAQHIQVPGSVNDRIDDRVDELRLDVSVDLNEYIAADFLDVDNDDECTASFS